MANISESINIARPVETVFAFAGDYRNDPGWRTGVTAMTVTPDADINLASVTREVLNFAGKVYTTEAQVVAWEPNRKTAFKSIAGAQDVEGERLFADTRAGTHFTYNLKISSKSVLDSLMLPVLTLLFRNQLRQDLKKLKGILEQN